MTGDVRALVFDLDGVLVDSEEMWDEVRRALAAEQGRPWPPAATRAMQGMATREWSSYLVEEVGLLGTPEEAAATVIGRMAARYDEELPLLPGAVDAVTRLGRRWPLGLASSSPRRLIDTVLAAPGLAGTVQVSLSTEEVSSGKPSPAVYQEVMRRMGVAPSTAVAIEDSANGLRSAASSGLAVIAIPNPVYPPDEESLALAAAVISSLDELTVDLVAAVGRRPR